MPHPTDPFPPEPLAPEPGRASGSAAALALLALAGLAGLGGLGGCATALPAAAPALDARLGEATRQALAQQVLRPQAGTEPAAAAGFDGVAAVHVLARHREGFKAPPSTFGLLGIGSASGQP